jgi:hypothetical protein
LGSGSAIFGISGFVSFFTGCLVAQGISEVSKALIFGALGFCPALFKFGFVAAFGFSGWALVILLGGQCHKLFLGLR